MNKNDIVKKKRKLPEDEALYPERIRYYKERTRTGIAWFVIISFVTFLFFPLFIFFLSVTGAIKTQVTLSQVYNFWKNIAAIFGPIAGVVIAYYFKSLE